jgi:ABC-type amino acid transport substrate-binding protein
MTVLNELRRDQAKGRPWRRCFGVVPANAAVAAIEAKLGMPDLKVKFTPITSQNRIPLVLNNTIYFECGSTGNLVERQSQVAFSNSIFLIGTRLMPKKDSGVKDWADRGPLLSSVALDVQVLDHDPGETEELRHFRGR